MKKLEALLGTEKFQIAGVNGFRRRTFDAAFTYRMGAGTAGDVSRAHPMATIEQALQDATHPATFYGQAVMANPTASTVRVPATGDSSSTQIYGTVVRPYPTQPSTATNYGAVAFGLATPPSTGILDVIRRGYWLVTLQGAAIPGKGSPVFVCCVAGTGYVVGGFSTDTVSGTFMTLDASYTFNGAPDASGVVEVIRA